MLIVIVKRLLTLMIVIIQVSIFFVEINQIRNDYFRLIVLILKAFLWTQSWDENFIGHRDTPRYYIHVYLFFWQNGFLWGTRRKLKDYEYRHVKCLRNISKKKWSLNFEITVLKETRAKLRKFRILHHHFYNGITKEKTTQRKSRHNWK